MSGSAGKTQILVNTTTVADGDSIASYLADGSGNFLTSQVIQAIRRLDVNGPSDWAEDAAHTSGDFGSFVLAVRNDVEGSLVDADGDYAPFQVDTLGRLRTVASFASNFTYAEDSAHISGSIGAFVLAVRNDTNAVLTSADGDYSPFAVDSAGRIKTVATGIFAEDSAAANADMGNFMLSVRRDTTAANTSANGDYAEIQSWANGELKMADIVNLSNLQQVIAVGTTALALPTAALALRKNLFIQNISAGGHVLYLGSATVTNTGATRGFRIGGGGYVSVEAGPAQAIFGIASAAGCDTVVWEFS